MSTNQFQALFKDNKNIDKNGFVRNKNGEIDFLATIPDFAVLYEAMERGENWFDVMYPRGSINLIDTNNVINANDWCKVENKQMESGKKRKYPFKNDENNAVKRIRHE